MTPALMRTPLLAALVLAACDSSGAAHGALGVDGDLAAGDWPHYAGDAGAMGYSPLADINRDNVSELNVAWVWETGEEPLPGPRLPIPGESVRPGSFEVTPIVLNDTMYVSTPYNRVVALDAATGRELWTFDPGVPSWTRTTRS